MPFNIHTLNKAEYSTDTFKLEIEIEHIGSFNSDFFDESKVNRVNLFNKIKKVYESNQTLSSDESNAYVNVEVSNIRKYQREKSNSISGFIHYSHFKEYQDAISHIKIELENKRPDVILTMDRGGTILLDRVSLHKSNITIRDLPMLTVSIAKTYSKNNIESKYLQIRSLVDEIKKLYNQGMRKFYLVDSAVSGSGSIDLPLKELKKLIYQFPSICIDFLGICDVVLGMSKIKNREIMNKKMQNIGVPGYYISTSLSGPESTKYLFKRVKRSRFGFRCEILFLNNAISEDIDAHLSYSHDNKHPVAIISEDGQKITKITSKELSTRDILNILTANQLDPTLDACLRYGKTINPINSLKRKNQYEGTGCNIPSKKYR